TPIETTAGFRFRSSGSRGGAGPGVIPYVGAGVGWYKLSEESDFSDGTDDVDSHHTGYLAVGGAEFRLHRVLSAAIDVQYTHVPGLLGKGGISMQVGEKDLGGVSARFRLLIELGH